MNPVIKAEIVSFVQTFGAVFIATGVPLLINFDYSTASRTTLIALGIAVLRTCLKATWEKFSKAPDPTVG
jgi:hypothetical protein